MHAGHNLIKPQTAGTPVLKKAGLSQFRGPLKTIKQRSVVVGKPKYAFSPLFFRYDFIFSLGG